MQRVLIDFADIIKVIKTNASWVYTGVASTVMDDDKNIFIKVTSNYVEFVVKSSSVLIKERASVLTDGVSNDDPWYIVLNYSSLATILLAYEKLACTSVPTISFELDDRNIKMTVYEDPKDGYLAEYGQAQTYLFNVREYGHVTRLFENIEPPKEILNLDIANLSLITETMVPKLLEARDKGVKLQFEKQNVFVKDSECIYTYSNVCSNVFYSGLAIGRQGASVLRNFVKYVKGRKDITAGVTDNHVIIFADAMALYITRGSLLHELNSILNVPKYEWSVMLDGGYLLDILRRYDHASGEVPTTLYKDTNRLYMKLDGITQHVYTVEMSDEADKMTVYLPTKLIQRMILKKDKYIRLRVVEKKGRKKSAFYVAYLDGGDGSQWTSVLHLRKGG